MKITRIGITLFVLAVMAGPWYTVAGYSAVGNLISELAAGRRFATGRWLRVL